MTQATKVRLRFAKRGDLRLVSHHDLLRCLERMLRRAQIPIAHTQGYNPRPKITFALALGLGIESLCEVVDLELAEPLEPTELLERLKAAAPAGFDWTDARPLPADARPPRPRAVEYSFPVHEDRRAAAIGTLQSLLESQSWPLTRKRPQRESRFRSAPPPDRRRSDGRWLASLSFEGCTRWLRPPGRTARGPRAARPPRPRRCTDPHGPRALGRITRSICFVAQNADLGRQAAIDPG